MWRRWLIILATAGLAIGALIAFEVTEPTQHPSDKEHSASAQRKAAHDDPLSRFWEWSAGEPVAFFTFILALFTGALVVVSAIQIRFLIRADETARRTADAAKSAAEAATGQHLALVSQNEAMSALAAASKAANDLTNRMFVAEQRPWVNIQDIAVRPRTGDEWEFEVIIGNTGGSPATLARITVMPINDGDRAIDVMNRNLPETAAEMSTSITVFPGEKRTLVSYIRGNLETISNRPIIILVRYQHTAAASSHMTAGTIFCVHEGSRIVAHRIALSDFAI